MSIWTSVKSQPLDVIDVAYSLYEDQVRLTFESDQQFYLTLDQAILLVDKLKVAIAKQDNSTNG